MTGSDTAPSFEPAAWGATNPAVPRAAPRAPGEGRDGGVSGALHIERAMPGVRWLILGRLAVGLFIIAYVLISTRGWGRNWADKTVYAVVTAVLAVNVAYLLLLGRVKSLPEATDPSSAGSRWGFRPSAEAFTRFQIAADIAVVASLVFLTGGASSQMVTLFLLSIMSASLLLSWRAAVAFASEAAVLHVFGAVVFFLLTRTPVAATWRPATAALGARDLLSSLFLQLLGFFAVAFLSGLLEHRLSLARLLSRDILEAIGQGLIVAGPSGRILFWNDEARRLLGGEMSPAVRTLEEALPRRVWEALVADPVTGEAHARDVALARVDGRQTPASVTVRPVLTEVARQAGTLVVITDRTLERRFEEATMQAQRSEAVSEMAAAIAHEIRNPLAAVRASVQEIWRKRREPSPVPGGETPTDSDALFDIVLSESDRLDAVISDFLAFAKMRPVRKSACDIGRAVEEAAAILRQSASPGEEAGPGRAVEIVTELDGEPHGRGDAPPRASAKGGPVCRADAQQLRQVLLNLGLNSLEALAGGPPDSRPGPPAGRGDDRPEPQARVGRIVLRVRPCAFLDFPLPLARVTARESGEAASDGPGEQAETEPARAGRAALPGERAGVQLEVEDNGCGMSPEVRRRALDPFFTRKERGTGLGLAVVDRIVKSHEGLVRIESEPGRGTRALVWLPAEG